MSPILITEHTYDPVRWEKNLVWIYANKMGTSDLMDESFLLCKAHIGWSPAVPSSMEKIKPQKAHLHGGTLKKLMAVKKGLNF